MSEELRSTAEKLETNQEELQSLKGDLQTANRELEARIDDIGLTNDDLRKLVISTDIGTIFVDRSLRVKLFTPRVRELFDLVPADVGRPLLDISSHLLGTTLGEDLAAVLDRLQTIEREVESRAGRWYLMRLLPYRTAEDRIDGVVLTFLEVTDQHRAQAALRQTQQRQAFLLKLSDALRPLADPSEIQQTAIRVLAEHLDLSRATYFEIDGDHYSVVAEHARGVPPLAGRYPLESFGEELLENHRSGRMTVVDDIASAHTPAEQQALAALNIRAYLTIPISKEEQFAGGISVHSRSPRAWTAVERSLIEEVAERTWAAVERARVQEALRNSEQRFRTLFDSVDDGFAMIELIRDQAGRTIDFRYVETNPAFVKHVGVDLKDKRRSELLSDEWDVLLEAYERVSRTGAPVRMEILIQSLAGRQDQWFQVVASRIGGTGSSKLGAVFRNITDRKRREANLQFLDGLAEDFSRLSQADEIMQTVGGRLGALLHVHSCHFVSVDDARAETRALYGWDSPEGSGAAGISRQVHRDLNLDHGRQTVVTSGRAPDESRPDEEVPAAGTDAIVAVPFRLDGARTCLFVVRHAGPRQWRHDEVELIEEVAHRLFPRLERATAEETLRQSGQRHRLIVEGARDYAILTTDVEGRITGWSPGAETIFGWTAAEAVGQLLDVTFPEDDRATGVPARERQAAREHGTAQNIRSLVRKDGSRVFIEGSIRALRDKGGALAGFLKIGQDVTQRTETEAALRESERRQRDELEERVQERTRQLAELSAHRQQLLERLVAATEAERQRIARELHDEMGQHLTALRLGLQALRLPGKDLEPMKTLVDRLDHSVDRLTFELRPTALDHLGLHGGITSLAEQFTASTGVHVDVHLPGVEGERFGDRIESAVYRVVQEALTNVSKHSGAKTVSVIAERHRDALRIIVEDDGRGFGGDEVTEAPRGHFGILGMRERLALVGGSIDIESRPGSGTSLYVRIPLGSSTAR